MFRGWYHAVGAWLECTVRNAGREGKGPFDSESSSACLPARPAYLEKLCSPPVGQLRASPAQASPWHADMGLHGATRDVKECSTQTARRRHGMGGHGMACRGTDLLGILWVRYRYGSLVGHLPAALKSAPYKWILIKSPANGKAHQWNPVNERLASSTYVNVVKKIVAQKFKTFDLYAVKRNGCDQKKVTNIPHDSTDFNSIWPKLFQNNFFTV